MDHRIESYSQKKCNNRLHFVQFLFHVIFLRFVRFFVAYSFLWFALFVLSFIFPLHTIEFCGFPCPFFSSLFWNLISTKNIVHFIHCLSNMRAIFMQKKNFSRDCRWHLIKLCISHTCWEKAHWFMCRAAILNEENHLPSNVFFYFIWLHLESLVIISLWKDSVYGLCHCLQAHSIDNLSMIFLLVFPFISLHFHSNFSFLN